MATATGKEKAEYPPRYGTATDVEAAAGLLGEGGVDDEDDEDMAVAVEDVKFGVPIGTYFLAIILNILCLPILVMLLFFPIFRVINPKQTVIFQLFGHPWKMLNKPGLQVIFLWVGTSQLNFSTRMQVRDIKAIKAVDQRGNPVKADAVISFVYEDVLKAAFAVENATTYVTSVSPAILRQILSHYSYNELRTNTHRVEKELRALMQRRVAKVGVRVVEFRLTDLSYSQEIAQAMLQVQQAEALLEAREKLVTGAVSIVDETLRQLQNTSITITDERAADLAARLLVVMTGERGVQPTIAVESI